MSYSVGDTYPFSLTIRDVDGNLADPESLIVSVREPDATVSEYVYGTDAIVVRDSIGDYHADIPLTAAGMWVIAAATTNEDEIEGRQVAVSPAPTAAVTFATLDELALRLPGAAVSAAELTDKQAAQGQMLLESVTDLIIDEVDRDAEWAATLDPIPRALRAVCLEAVARVMQNPGGARSESETLGVHQHSVSYTDGAHGLELSDRESRLCRLAVIGQLSGSAAVDSIATTVADRAGAIDGWVGEANPDIYEDIT